MPSTINKGSLLSQVDSIINSLNLSTDETRRLALFYKSALNARSNTIYSESNVAVQMVSRLANTTSTDSKELLMLATGAGQVTDDRVVTVANTTVLNALANVSTGTIYFVESDGYPYIRKSDNTWTPLSKAFKVYNAWAWGSNNLGQLGNGTTTGSDSPVSVVGGFTDWKQLSAGANHSLGIRANGTLWAWGQNSSGELGDTTTTNRSSPVSVVGGFTDWIDVTGGSFHSVGLRANGILYSWGSNYVGQLGNGATLPRSSPVSVLGGFTNWISISAGTVHTLALQTDGTLWSWGRNQYGQIGDNTNVNKSSPVSVIGGFTDWTFSAAGGFHSLGIRANGVLYAWGLNTNGQLGDNTTSNKSSPVSVVGGFTDWASASGGRYHSHGIRANGTLWGWGANNSRQVGDGTSTARSSPVSVVGGFTDWVGVTGLFRSAVGIRANGTLWRWGDGTSSPVSIVGGYTDWISVSGCGGSGVVTLGLRA